MKFDNSMFSFSKTDLISKPLDIFLFVLLGLLDFYGFLTLLPIYVSVFSLLPLISLL